MATPTSHRHSRTSAATNASTQRRVSRAAVTRESSARHHTPAATARGAVIVVCSRCEVASGPYPTRGEAQLLADRHDQVHHRGRRTAQLTEQNVCESCRRAPATTTWARPAAGAPFALCRDCHPNAGPARRIDPA